MCPRMLYVGWYVGGREEESRRVVPDGINQGWINDNRQGPGEWKTG